jgi:hypothetical protein
MKNWKPYSSIKNNGRGHECLVNEELEALLQHKE